MVPREKMAAAARHLRDTYAITPGIPLIQQEFGFYCLEEWQAQGLAPGTDLAAEFGYDPGGSLGLGALGWCEAAFCPAFEDKVLEERGETEVVQDYAGRHVLVFKGRRHGFMPEYIDHPVKDWKTWEENVKWRLAPDAPGRFAYLDDLRPQAVAAAAQGHMLSQHVIGGYMYLRSLFGPEGVLYAFYDHPELVHECMATWLELAEAVITRHQEFVTLDELFLAEDICYNHGPLCSPDMFREFLAPYYRRLVQNLKARQIDRERRLFIHVDTDGWLRTVTYCAPLGSTRTW
jgi:uroporphyrinogen decarboxylase